MPVGHIAFRNASFPGSAGTSLAAISATSTDGGTPNWAVTTGAWAADGSGAVASSGTSAAEPNLAAPSDGNYDLDLVFSTAGTLSLYTCNGDVNYYLIYFHAGSVDVMRVSPGGGTSTLATYSLSVATAATLKIAFRRSGGSGTVTVTANGSTLGTANDPFPPPTSGAKLASIAGSGSAATLSSFSATLAPAANATWTGPSSATAGAQSTVYTATLDHPAGAGGIVVSLASDHVADHFQATSGGGDVTTVTVADGSSAGTFYLTPAAAGTSVVTPTATGIAFSPTTKSLTVAAAGMAWWCGIDGVPAGITPAFALEDTAGNAVTLLSGGTPADRGADGAGLHRWVIPFTAAPGLYIGVITAGDYKLNDEPRAAGIPGDVGGRVLGGGAGVFAGIGARANIAIDDELLKESDGVAAAVGSTTITLDATANDPGAAADLAGWTIEVVRAGTGAGQSRMVASSNTSTRVQTLDSAWSPTPSGTVAYLRHPPSGNVAGKVLGGGPSTPTAVGAWAKSYIGDQPLRVEDGTAATVGPSTITLDPQDGAAGNNLQGWRILVVDAGNAQAKYQIVTITSAATSGARAVSPAWPVLPTGAVKYQKIPPAAVDVAPVIAAIGPPTVDCRVVGGSTGAAVIVSGLPAGRTYVGQRLYHYPSSESRVIASQSFNASNGRYTFAFTGRANTEDGPFNAMAAGDAVLPVP